MSSRVWTVRLSASAQADFDNIVAWTADQFGVRQARTYARTLSLALQYLSGGPQQLGIRAWPKIGVDMLTLHVARAGRRGRHVLLLRHQPASSVIDVLRVLHDGMDLPRHLPV